ncbi:MAG: hypothetical protein QN834_07365 [Nitrososphaeraceae archaeon]|nr:hypothetical protein [Nitrososphaeraceae archaeon]
MVQKSVLLFAALGLVMAALIAAVATSTNTSEAFPKGKDHKEMVFGAISSIQNNEEGKPAWVLSGHWLTNIVNKTKDSFNQTNAAKFDSWLYMAILEDQRCINMLSQIFHSMILAIKATLLLIKEQSL